MTDKLFDLIKNITPTKWHWVLNHDGYKRYFANMSWMFGGQMLSLLVSFVVGVWIARYLGPENYGTLNYSLAFVGIFAFISSLGIDNILNRDLIKYPDKRDGLLGTAFRLKLIGGILAMLFSIVGVFIFEKNSLIRLLVSMFSVSFIFQSINIIGNYFNSQVQAKYNFKSNIITFAISALLKIIIIFLNKGIIWFIAIYALDALWQGIGFFIFYKKAGFNISKWFFDKDLAKDILKNSWPLMFASAASFIYLKIDQVMIGAMLGNHEVGIYASAVKLVEVWYFFPVVICSSLFPAIINAKKTDSNLYKKRLKNFYFLLLFISLIMVIPISLLSKTIIYLLFGSSYMTAVPVLRVYIWSSIGLFLGLGVNQYLLSENFVRVIFRLNLLAMFVNIILNLIFIPKFGIIGAAYATLISYMITPLYLLIIKNKKYDYI